MTKIKRLLLVFAIMAMVAFTACLGFAVWRISAPSHFTVINVSGIEIRNAKITVDGQMFNTGSLRTNAKQRFKFDINHDSGYVANVEFIDGQLLDGRGGYVTGGYICDDDIVIDKDEVFVVQDVLY